MCELECNFGTLPNPLSKRIECKRDWNHGKGNESNQAVSPPKPKHFIHAEASQWQHASNDRPEYGVCCDCGSCVQGESIDEVLLDSVSQATPILMNVIIRTCMQINTAIIPMPNNRVPNNGIAHCL